MLIWNRPNLILLDEPTNHLDLEMRHALSMALQAYEGGMVMVSHDRTLLGTCCEQFMLVAEGKATVFDGDLEDYKAYLQQQPSTHQSLAATTVAARQNSYQQKKADRQARLAERRPLVKKLAQLETQMTTLAEAEAEMQQQLADPDIYQPEQKQALQTLLVRQAENQRLLNDVESAWLEVQSALDALPASD